MVCRLKLHLRITSAQSSIWEIVCSPAAFNAPPLLKELGWCNFSIVAIHHGRPGCGVALLPKITTGRLSPLTSCCRGGRWDFRSFEYTHTKISEDWSKPHHDPRSRNWFSILTSFSTRLFLLATMQDPFGTPTRLKVIHQGRQTRDRTDRLYRLHGSIRPTQNFEDRTNCWAQDLAPCGGLHRRVVIKVMRTNAR